MDVFTYTGDTVVPEDQTNWLPKKNCRIKINFPAGMSESMASSLVELIRSKTMSDILLYGAVSFISSEEDSKLFPSSEYALLVIPSSVATHINNIDNSSFVVFADGVRSIFMLNDDSILHNDKTGDYIMKTDDGICVRADSVICSDAPKDDTNSDWIFAL